jgi:hypothetical protein
VPDRSVPPVRVRVSGVSLSAGPATSSAAPGSRSASRTATTFSGLSPPDSTGTPAGSLPELDRGAFDPSQRLAAFLDAVRWSAVTSADTASLQGALPLRGGDRELPAEPVARTVATPSVNLLLADDVGLGKTIEARPVAPKADASRPPPR